MTLRQPVLGLLLALSTVTCWSQTSTGTYQRSWKRIDSLIEKNGQLKTALAEVNGVYARAKKENDQPEIIRALIYRLNITERITDDGDTRRFSDVQTELQRAPEPSASILRSILAGMYWQYLQQNRYRIYRRSQTVHFVAIDPATWTIADLHRKISALFLASVNDVSLLAKTDLATWSPVIIRGNARALRPTLFDLLAHRALEYFTNDERDVTEPAYTFEITDTMAFAPAADFVKHRFISSDSTSLYFRALTLMQTVLSRHLWDRSPDALLDADIERISFVHDHFVGDNGENLFRRALSSLSVRFPDVPAAARAQYLLANSYANAASTYHPFGDTTNRYAYVEAKRLCEQVLMQRDSSEGKANCANLLAQIKHPSLSTTAEHVNVPGKPFRLLLQYKNIANVYFRIISMRPGQRAYQSDLQYSDEYWKSLSAKTPFRSFTIAPPDTKDFQAHSVEVAVDSLPAGEYVLLASAASDFSMNKNVMALQYLYVSNIAYITRGNEYYVVDRESGEAIAGATIQLWERRYNYQTSKNQLYKLSSYPCDRNGYCKTASRTNPAIPEVIVGKEHLFLNEEVYSYVYDGNAAKNASPHAFLFTDRAIYRPGQTVYFKGILTKTDSAFHSAILPGLSTMAVLYDANGQRVDSMMLTTSEWGSYSGKFRLPEAGLNGNFYIEDAGSHDQVNFRVEEYKRPRFSVALQQPAGSYRLNDTIRVQALAKAYAGNNIDGAKVSYRVTRNVNRVYDFSLPRIWPPVYGSETEIAHGITTTGSDGSFRITFRAIPDVRMKSSLFSYTVTADVTDAAGETRSAVTSLSVGESALQLMLDLPPVLPVDSLRNIAPRPVNSNGLITPASVTLTIDKLSTRLQPLRSRYWPEPDQFLLTREAYHALFPLDPYAHEADPESWPVEQRVFARTQIISSDTTFAAARTWSPGWYKIEAQATDSFGTAVKTTRWIMLTGNTISSPTIATELQVNRTTARPGDTISYRLVTNAGSIHAIGEVLTASRQASTLQQPSGSFRLSEEDRGTAVINISFIKNNRLYTEQRVVAVPFYNRQLNITYASFRDNTLPGVPEKWQVRVAGHDGEKVAAELLTSMYDASLDAFAPHRWSVPVLPVRNFDAQAWSGTGNFRQESGLLREFGDEAGWAFDKTYDQLLAPGANARVGIMIGGYLPGVVSETQAVRYKKTADQAVALPAPAATAQSDFAEPEQAQNSKPSAPAPDMPVRSNLQETAFFFPELHTDSAGNIEFGFTSPESLTTWKWMLLAHTKALAFTYDEKNIVTRKDFMVQPNMPRFLRQGDQAVIAAKIVNLSNRDVAGQATIELLDAVTGESVLTRASDSKSTVAFTLPASQSRAALFPVNIPERLIHPVICRITASSGTLSDGEESIIPVLNNRALVTESMPLNVTGSGEKKFTWEKLLASGDKTSLQHQALTVEFSSNPSWYAVEALPYLSAGEKATVEGVFSSYYASALSARILARLPYIKNVIERWTTTDTAALMSNLQKNEQLKSLLLTETPWVFEAKTEAEQKQRLVKLFDAARLTSELNSTLRKLKAMQAPSGGFVWCTGGAEDRYMTQYVLTGLGRLQRLGAADPRDPLLQSIIRPALAYADKQLRTDYERLKRSGKKLPAATIDNLSAQFLYMRSFFNEPGVSGDVFPAYNYFRNQSKQAWLHENTYLRSMIAVSLFRTGDRQTAGKIMRALRESAITQDELGVHWKDMTPGYVWYESPIEAASTVLESFSEVAHDTVMADQIKTWLLRNKQTNNWRTTRATADACYALLLEGSEWTRATPQTTIVLGDTTITGSQSEAGTGYFRRDIPGTSVSPRMGSVTVHVSGQQPGASSWGAVYWQYFEDLDRITPAKTPLQISRGLFVEEATDRGPAIKPLDGQNTVRVGDKIRVRIELRCDRPMEYVHLKDMRASCLEPVNVLSEYKWQDGLGYYETTRDASTDFFFGNLPAGVFVFEYPLVVNAAGTFSNGIANIECLYAPEFSSHSEGITLHSLPQ